VRKLYAGQVATQVGLPVHDLVRLAEWGTRRPQLRVAAPARRGPRENAEFVAVALLVHEWNTIAPWLVEALFVDELCRRAFLALAAADGDLTVALTDADPDARELLESAAVVDVEADAEIEARNLIAAATRRELGRGARLADPELIRQDREARLQLEDLQHQSRGPDAAEWLLAWLSDRTEERVHGGN
jgi:DNA primase